MGKGDNESYWKRLPVQRYTCTLGVVPCDPALPSCMSMWGKTDECRKHQQRKVNEQGVMVQLHCQANWSPWKRLWVSLNVFPEKQARPASKWTTQSHGLRFQTKHKGKGSKLNGSNNLCILRSKPLYSQYDRLPHAPCLTSHVLREPKYTFFAEVAFVGCFATAGVLEVTGGWMLGQWRTSEW